MSMTDQKFQQLVQNHPRLFEKAGDIEFSVDDGWFNIIDNLCGLISYRIEAAHLRLRYYLENPEKAKPDDVSKAEKEVANAYAELPTLVQIKEKFGSLRFYYDGGNATIENYVTFAEYMSRNTCEVCGAPGESHNDGWVKVLCDKHRRGREEKNSSSPHLSRKPNTVKLSDET